jgi:hypothetical protein
VLPTRSRTWLKLKGTSLSADSVDVNPAEKVYRHNHTLVVEVQILTTTFGNGVVPVCVASSPAVELLADERSVVRQSSSCATRERTGVAVDRVVRALQFGSMVRREERWTGKG